MLDQNFDARNQGKQAAAEPVVRTHPWIGKSMEIKFPKGHPDHGEVIGEVVEKDGSKVTLINRQVKEPGFMRVFEDRQFPKTYDLADSKEFVPLNNIYRYERPRRRLLGD